MKKSSLIISCLLTGLFCINLHQAVVLPDAHAEEQLVVTRDRYCEGEFGEVLCSNWSGNCYLVITNKNGFLHLENPLYTIRDDGFKERKIEGFYNFSESDLQTMCAADSSLADLLSAYDMDAINAYTVYVYQEFASSENTLIRQLCIDNSDVYCAVKLSYNSIQSHYWCGALDIVPTDASKAKTHAGQNFDDQFQELSGTTLDSAFEPMSQTYQDWKSRYAAWESTVDPQTMTAAELAASKKAAGVETDYEMLQYAFDVCENFAIQYPELVVGVEPGFDLRYKVTADFQTFSVWDNVGDLTGDGQITAEDAADLLTAAANQGAGSDSGLSDSQQQYADVNADGVFNAEDAAILLMYAAEKGSGSNMTLEEFMMNK